MKTKVGYLGPDGVTFGSIAAERYFTGYDDVEFVPFKSHEEVCIAVGRKVLNYGVVAVENKIDGPITETIRAVEDIHGKFGIQVCGEITIPIEHYALRLELSETLPQKIVSHTSAIRQCRKFINSMREQGIAVEVAGSTGEAAKIASEDASVVALASYKAQELYKLVRVVPESVADNDTNKTRFWILGKDYADHTGNDKSCFLLNLEQSKSGVLCRSLMPFADRNIGLLVIIPNPIPGKEWEYTFLIEFKGHILDPEMEEAYNELRTSGLCWSPPSFIGSYPDTTTVQP